MKKENLSKSEIDILLKALKELPIKEGNLISVIEKISRMRYQYSLVTDKTL